jgi:hypothetical protein
VARIAREPAEGKGTVLSDLAAGVADFLVFEGRGGRGRMREG